MKLIALLITFAFCHYVPKPATYRPFEWLFKWAGLVSQKLKIQSAEIRLIVVIAVPILALFILFSLFDVDKYDVFLNLIITVVVLFYCIGPESIGDAMSDGTLKKQLDLRANASDKKIIDAITLATMQRWFSILFWYVVLGLVGAIIYRLAERLTCREMADKDVLRVAHKAVTIMNYPVAWFMTFALAIASDFEKIFKQCKPYMNQKNLLNIETQFLYKSMQCAVEHYEIEEQDENLINIVEQTTLKLLKRMLVVWLVIVSVLVIFAIMA
ncbi:MAG: hypothetical protein L3J52_08185 [Proteobacteria bacterium]|nr:hypothetical protein [Pseudomonadota bacterium]